jgi:general secretion pathway protein G
MRRDSIRRRRGGFTLMEVLLVLAILVILGSLAVGVFTGTQRSANINAAKGQVGLIDSALERYRFDIGEFPADLTALRSMPPEVVDPNKWSGPYLNKEVGLDPWDNPYQYNPSGGRNTDKPDLWSFGPDEQDGTDDDIGNWQ